MPPDTSLFVGCRRGANVDDLVDLSLELVEAKRPVVQGAWKAEAVLHKAFLASAVAVGHGAKLRQHGVGLVYYYQEIVREIVYESIGPGTGRIAYKVARIVLYALAGAYLPHHLEVVAGALLQPLGLQQPAAVRNHTSRSSSSSSMVTRALSMCSLDVA